MIPQVQMSDTPFKKLNVCMHCRGQVFVFAVDSEGIFNITVCDNYNVNDNLHEFPYLNISSEQKRVEIINAQKLNLLQMHPEDLIRRLYSLNLSQQLRGVLDVFIKEWPQSRKDMAHKAILENPDGKQICRPISDSDVTNINIFNRNAIFLILSKHERAKLTEKDEKGKVHDLLKRRKIKSWNEDLEIMSQGPVVCDNDKLIFDACLKLHHERGFIGITLKTSYSEIWRTLGNNSRIGTKNIDAIKRSLSRLSAVNIQIISETKSKKYFWSGGIIDTIKSEECSNSKFSRILIKFNDHLVSAYLKGGYSTLRMNSLLELRCYPRRMFEFLATHKDPQKTISLTKWKEIVGVEDDVPSYTFKQRIKEAIAELKEYGHLTPKSGFVTNARGEDMIFTELVRDINQVLQTQDAI